MKYTPEKREAERRRLQALYPSMDCSTNAGMAAARTRERRASYLEAERRRRQADLRRSPLRPDQQARLEAFRAWVLKQGADLITIADARARLAVAEGIASRRLSALVDEGVLEKVSKGEWRLRGRTL